MQTDDANVAFEGVNYALLVGSRPRSKGMERKDLLEANGAIFTVQGKALSDNAADDVRVLVVGNPANTNCLIAMNNAPNIPNERFTAMTRLDHNRAMAQLATKTGTTVNDITKMTIWGNHSATQYPDLFHAEVNGKIAADVVDDQAWIEGDVHPHRAAARRRHHRGPRPVRAPRRPPTPPSTTCTPGSPAPPRATGSRWPSRPTAATACPRASCPRSPSPPRTASTRSCRASSTTSSPRPSIDATVAELVEERDTVAELGLI